MAHVVRRRCAEHLIYANHLEIGYVPGTFLLFVVGNGILFIPNGHRKLGGGGLW